MKPELNGRQLIRTLSCLLGATGLLVAASSCSSAPPGTPAAGGDGAPDPGASASPSPGGAGGGGAGGGGAGGGGAGGGGALTDGASADAVVGTTDGGAASEASTATDATSADPLNALRQACIDKINELRSTKSLPPYTRWSSNESCTDGEVTHDQQVGIAHDAMNHGNSCGESGQGECQGLTPTVGNVQRCLTAMWAEKDQQGCGGCDSCPWATNCADCNFLGCGHYMALSSRAFTTAACGFPPGPNAGWIGIDYR